MFEVKNSDDYTIIKELFSEYSQIKGAEGCFVSFDKKLADLERFYKNGAILVGYEDSEPIGCIAIKKVDQKKCEAKRLFVRPEYRGKGYSRIILNAMLKQGRELGYEEVVFKTKPSVMQTAYKLYKRMGFEEIRCDDGIVSMRIDLLKLEA